MKWIKLFFKTFIFDPLAGGNGKIQTSELAQWALMIMIICASVKEGRSAEQLYPDIYWIMLFASVCGIAAIKPAFGRKDVKDETEGN